MPNYYVFIVRKFLFKNIKRKRNMLDREDSIEEKGEGSVHKYSTLLKTSILKKFKENSLSFSEVNISNTHKDFNIDEISCIPEKNYNTSQSPSICYRNSNETISKKSIKKTKIESLPNRKIDSNNEMIIRCNSKMIDKVNKQILKPINIKNQNSMKIIMNNVVGSYLPKEKKLTPYQYKEKSVTPIIRIQKMPSNTPINYRPTGYLTSRNETATSLLKKNYIKDSTNNLVSKFFDKNTNKQKLKFDIEKKVKDKVMIKNTVLIKKIISNILTPRSKEFSEIKKPQDSRIKNISVKNIQNNKFNLQKSSSNYNTIKSPSIFNINLNLNLNVNLNMNANNNKGYSNKILSKHSENNHISQKILDKNVDELSILKIKKINSKNSEGKLPLTDRVIRNSMSKKPSFTEQQGHKLVEINSNYKTILKPITSNVLIPRNTMDASLKSKLVLKKSDPINLKSDFAHKIKLNAEERYSNNYLRTESNKECDFKLIERNNFKGIKINNFEKIYEVKDSPKNLPNSTTRESKEKVNKLLFK